MRRVQCKRAPDSLRVNSIQFARGQIVASVRWQTIAPGRNFPTCATGNHTNQRNYNET